MRKTTEVLCLAAQGLSQRQIAAGAGVGKTTVAEYLARAAKAGISWPLPEGVDADALDAALFPAVAAEVANRSPSSSSTTSCSARHRWRPAGISSR